MAHYFQICAFLAGLFAAGYNTANAQDALNIWLSLVLGFVEQAAIVGAAEPAFGRIL